MLEAVVVVGVLLALAVGGFLAYGPIVKNAKLAKVKSAVSEVYTAVTVAQIDGDSTTSVISVIDTYNASQETIKFEIRRGENQPSIAAMSTENYVPQSDNDFCLKATTIGDVNIFAEMGDCEPPVVAPTPTLSPAPSPTATPIPTPTSTTPPAYVDPTPTRTVLTYKCDTNTTGMIPFATDLTGTETWSDAGFAPRNYTNASKASTRALSAGVEYTATFEGTYKAFTAITTEATAFSKCLTAVNHLGENTGLEDMTYAFNRASKLTDVPARIPSSVNSLKFTFYATTILNDPDISKWDVSNVNNLYATFHSAPKFNQPLDSWNVSNVTSMQHTFNTTGSFNQPLNSWDTSKVTNMSSMFQQSVAFDQPLDKWDVSQVTSMNYMFYANTKFNQNLSGWTTTKLPTTGGGVSFAPASFPTSYMPPKTSK
jgi:surface protein